MTKLIAFDIDEVLTKKQFREIYQRKLREGHTVGVITSRRMESAQEFIDTYNLNPDFVRSTPFKGKAMRDLADKYTDQEDYVYYGSWIKDEFQTLVSGWNYGEAA